ncbi:FolC bifunctional protein [Acidimicrobium ferrooxidans DSM 10331]|uniref:FolC bifunctional protein n=1 Tax=Acidimicrobium ferrooxidans (strain DSM 10331 / JCM 15462 / NBRC 103882 / ICP) TaxID=525909 RepID=C7LYA4_ACIFD|nr:folylpolyglutamate synthase [Acidimicrobium ferrooxidans]ACU53712.1 FolC bifunctional protein [Acidimicrobium ferrooxidans DSM 10331]
MTSDLARSADPRRWLGELPDFEADRSVTVHGPAVVRAALDALGAPDRDLVVVSVAGTAGKGSTATLLAALLASVGVRAALFRSPHLCRWEERFVVATEPVEAAAIDEELEQIRLASEAGLLVPLTRFEVETVLAVQLAAREGCEVLVAEAGLGAREDATRALEPALAIVTAIGDDHRAELGPTLESIAAHELGIAAGAPTVVLGELGAVGERVAARQLGAVPRVRRLGIDRAIVERHSGVAGQSVVLDDGRELLLPFIGRPGAQSMVLAVVALEELLSISLEAAHIDAVARRAVVPGVPWLHRQPVRAVSDLAHNALAIRALAETVAETFPPDLTWRLVIGLTHGRDPRAVFEGLGTLKVDEVIGVDVGVATEVLGEAARELWPSARWRSAASVEEALSEAPEDDVWTLVTGSLRIVAPLRCAEAPSGIIAVD